MLDRLPSAIGDQVTALNQRMIFGDLSDYGLSRPPKGLVSSVRERRIGPIIDDGFVEAVKAGRIEIVPGFEGFDQGDAILAGDQRINPDVVIAATGYERGLEPLVGHLGVIGEHGEPQVKNGATHPNAPGLYFVGLRRHPRRPLAWDSPRGEKAGAVAGAPTDGGRRLVAMLHRALERAYRNLGSRYLDRAVVAQLQLIHPLLVFNICALGLYVDLDTAEFLLLVLTAVGGMAAYNVLYARVAKRCLEPVRWLKETGDTTIFRSAPKPSVCR